MAAVASMRLWGRSEEPERPMEAPMVEASAVDDEPEERTVSLGPQVSWEDALKKCFHGTEK